MLITNAKGEPNSQKLPVAMLTETLPFLPLPTPCVIYTCLCLGDREQVTRKLNIALRGGNDAPVVKY